MESAAHFHGGFLARTSLRSLEPKTASQKGGPLPAFLDCSKGTLLEEAADRFPLDAEADHAAHIVDLLDRFGRDEPPPAREEAGADRKGIRLVGSGAVHRALHASDEAAPLVGYEKAGGRVEIDCERAHDEGRYSRAVRKNAGSA
jgi:hypothetical protein